MAQIIISIITLVAVIALIIIVLIKKPGQGNTGNAEATKNLIITDVQKSIFESSGQIQKNVSETTQSSMKSLSELLVQNQNQFKDSMTEQIKGSQESNEKQIKEIQQSTEKEIQKIGESMDKLIESFEQKMEGVRNTMSTGMKNIQEENSKKLDEIKGTVDEKLQSTLESRITESFKRVSEQLEQVYKGLGEMQNLANDVGGLKRVLSGVKTRGILGEIQLGAILKEILSPSQYEENVATVKGSTERVEFAIKLPGQEDGSFVYLPIDSKFPGERYAQLVDAQENGDKDLIQTTYKALEQEIKKEAKDIHDKYISVPDTTSFGIMFLPFEGLYAEVVNRGLVEELQKKYQINIAGPSTMAALLNSIQMGFKTLAIQKRSNEVWNILSATKTEFEKFEDVLKAVQNRLKQSSDELDKLIGTRTRAINRQLRNVETLETVEIPEIIDMNEITEE